MNLQLRTSLGRFLIVGSTTVLVDLAAYSALALAGMAIDVAKAVGFLTGTLFAYFANRTYTFRATGSAIVFLKFLFIYFLALCLNVGVNHAFIVLFAGLRFTYESAFVTATGVSAIFNYLGMRYIVFTHSGPGR